MLWQVKKAGKTFLVDLPDQLGDDRPFPLKIGEKSFIGRWHGKTKSLHISSSDPKSETHSAILKTRSIILEKAADESETQVHLEISGAGIKGVSRFSATVDVYTPASAGKAAEGAAKAKILRSPMTGKVLAINVKPDDVIEQGSVLMVIEAMKMENKIYAPKAGKIQGIKITVGQSVSVSQELLTIA